MKLSSVSYHLSDRTDRTLIGLIGLGLVLRALQVSGAVMYPVVVGPALVFA